MVKYIYLSLLIALLSANAQTFDFDDIAYMGVRNVTNTWTPTNFVSYYKVPLSGATIGSVLNEWPNESGTASATRTGSPVYAGNYVWMNGAEIFSEPDRNALDMVNTLSIFVKCYVTNTSIPYPTILCKGRGSGVLDTGYALRLSSGKITFYYRNEVFHIWESTSAISAGWSSILLTFTFGTGSSLAMRVNGSVVSGSWIAGSGNVVGRANGYPLKIGEGGSGENFVGGISTVIIYDRIVSSDESARLFEL